LQLQIGANQDQELAVRVPVLNTRSMYIDDLNVTEVKGADKGIYQADVAISMVSAARSKMGAYENRLDYAIGSLDASEENMTNAISRLGDVDMATEMTEYTNKNVLTQASISVLSQANDLPQQVLSLLQG
ncbi:MAG: flagellin, partial [Eubacterium sp.]|nr:flagellin [Eubacterium sp.]